MPWKVQEGDSGYGVLQTHEMGIHPEQIELLKDALGWDPLRFDAGALQLLADLVGDDVAAFLKVAEAGDDGDDGDLLDAIDPLFEPERWAGLPVEARRLLAYARPIRIHTDLRLVPEGEQEWHGGEVLTPGNQFAWNPLRALPSIQQSDLVLPMSVRRASAATKRAIKSHSTETAEGPWDGPAAEARLKTEQSGKYYRAAFAWVDPDGDPATKAAYKFIHHEVDADGTIGAANLRACQAGLAVLNGARGGTTTPKGDVGGVRRHLERHLRDAKRGETKKAATGLVLASGPMTWLRITDGGPYIAPPGRSGADQTGFARLSSRDSFSWMAGVQTPDTCELWISWGNLNGRWLLRSGVNGVDLVRPAEQSLESPVMADIQPAAKRVAKRRYCPILKAEDKEWQRIVVGPVLIPDEVDAQGQVISAEEIEKTAHAFLAKYNVRSQNGLMHRRGLRALECVESWIQREDVEFPTQNVVKGTWMMAVHVADDDIWARVLDKTYTGFSIGGYGTIERLTESVQET